MKRILITGAGGAPSTNFVRSLRLSGRPYFIAGVDCDKYYLARAETDTRHLVPKANDPRYIPILNQIIKEYNIDMLVSQPDVEIEFISANRDKLETKLFFPPDEVIRTCQNKFESYKRWKDAGIRVPETMMVNTEDDLRRAWDQLRGPNNTIWVREISGAFGKGSLPAKSYDMAKKWIDFRNGWGKYSAAECLEDQSVTWQSIWKDGDLLVAQSRKRLYWEFANRAPSGVTGITGTGVTCSDAKLDDIALRTIKAVDQKPHGIYSVDLTYSADGTPNPTEINIARFFTTHLFFSQAGLNMPDIYVRAGLDEELPPIPKKINPLRDGLVWVRGMDVEPVLTTVEDIEKPVEELRQRYGKL
jgi:carbamoyl-phosphate synthase large subunit